jgi:6-phosphogluconate dehydrogenase
MMIGGLKGAVDHLDPVFAVLAPGLGDIPQPKSKISQHRSTMPQAAE